MKKLSLLLVVALLLPLCGCNMSEAIETIIEQIPTTSEIVEIIETMTQTTTEAIVIPTTEETQPTTEDTTTPSTSASTRPTTKPTTPPPTTEPSAESTTIPQTEPTTVPVTMPETMPTTEATTVPTTEATTIPTEAPAEKYYKKYSSSSGTITIYKEWYENAWCYAAHIELNDYTKFGTACAKGAYNNGREKTSSAAKRLGAIFAVNGCYSSPSLNYTVVRSGVIWNGSGRESFWCPAVYSYHNGKLQSAWDGNQGTPGISGGQIDQLVADGLVTDTFCFGPPGLVNGVIGANSDTSRAQRTFIGTNGKPGDIWVCVSDGRKNDGVSSGLTYKQCMTYLVSKGCTFGVNLDGGGSSTMYFDGKVLNAAKDNQRSVVDFVYFIG